LFNNRFEGISPPLIVVVKAIQVCARSLLASRWRGANQSLFVRVGGNLRHGRSIQ
jgi:hypothetical protein